MARGDETEVRQTSETGGQKGSKLARFDMIPTDALFELAEHYGKGAVKYPRGEDGVDNWRRGYPWSLSFAAAYRHLTLAMGGEDIDEETGSKHVIAVAWHMFVLAHQMNRESQQRFDDRQDKREDDPIMSDVEVAELLRRLAAQPSSGFVVGDRVTHRYRSGERGTITARSNDDRADWFVRFDGGAREYQVVEANLTRIAD